MVSEKRRCSKCGTKSYSDLMGEVTLSLYFCKKCNIMHSKMDFYHINERTLNMIDFSEKALNSMTVNELFVLIQKSSIANQLDEEKMCEKWRKLDQELERKTTLQTDDS